MSQNKHLPEVKLRGTLILGAPSSSSFSSSSSSGVNLPYTFVVFLEIIHLDG